MMIDSPPQELPPPPPPPALLQHQQPASNDVVDYNYNNCLEGIDTMVMVSARTTTTTTTSPRTNNNSRKGTSSSSTTTGLLLPPRGATSPRSSRPPTGSSRSSSMGSKSSANNNVPLTSPNSVAESKLDEEEEVVYNYNYQYHQSGGGGGSHPRDNNNNSHHYFDKDDSNSMMVVSEHHGSSFWDLDDSSGEGASVVFGGGGGGDGSGNTNNGNTAPPSSTTTSKMCFPGNSKLWNSLRTNKKKVASTDIASVGNASDTLVAIRRNIVGGRDLHESAKTHLNRREYSQALEYFEAILQAQLERFGAVHPSVAAAMHNVGVCRQRMHQPTLAANLLQEAVQIRKQTLGDTHVEVAVSLSKLGTAQAALKNYEQAFDSIREAVSISKQQMGYHHKTTAQMLCHLACFYFETSELYAAEATFTDAYEIYQYVWSNLQAEARDACMAQMTDTLCNIGSIQNRRKRYSHAVSTFSNALDLQMGIYGYDHPLVVATLDNLAYAYSKNKDYANALMCYQKMFKAQSKDTFSDSCLETFKKQMIMHEKLKKISEGYETAVTTLRLAKNMLPRQDKKLIEMKKIVDDWKKKMPSHQSVSSSSKTKSSPLSKTNKSSSSKAAI